MRHSPGQLFDELITLVVDLVFHLKNFLPLLALLAL
jgi:hypothetical protein